MQSIELLVVCMNVATVLSNSMLIYRQLKLESALERALDKNNQLLAIIAKEYGYIK
jgi:hypothetical protein